MNVSSEYNGMQPVIIPRARTQFIRAARPHKASDQCGITAFLAHATSAPGHSRHSRHPGLSGSH